MNDKEYMPLIKVVNGQIQYYVKIKDNCKHQNYIPVTEDVFLQFFGIHEHIKNLFEEHFYIVFENREYCIKKEVTKEMYYQFQSFKSMDIHEQNIFDRYIEHYDLTEENLYQRMMNNMESNIVDELYKKYIKEELYQTISELPVNQKRRLVLHYLKGFTLTQIAQKEGCSVPAVKYSIDHAINNLKKKMK